VKSVYLNDDHELFRENVRRFLDEEVAPHAVEWEQAGRLPRSIFRRMGELGYLGIDFPEKYGGTGADIFYSVVFLEELPRSLMGGFCASVSVQQYMATRHIFQAGSEDLKQRYLVPSIAGSKVGALSVTEPDAGSDVAAIRTSAVRDGDDYVINGTKAWITNGADGDFYTVAVKTDREAGTNGISLIVVDADTPGVVVGSRLHKLGLHSSDTAELHFEEVRVPASNLVGEENLGFYYLMEAFQLERLVSALMAVGSSQLCLDKTLEYMAGRQAFGRPLNRFQALRHRLADLASNVAAARQLTYHAAWLHQQGEQAITESSMAKLIATELSKRVADECLQCFGGYGYSEEYPLARFYRDARAGTILAGTSEIMREIISRMMIDRMEPPPITSRRTALSATRDDRMPAGAPVEVVQGTVPALMRSLPSRLRSDKVEGWRTCFHFSLPGGEPSEWTVRIDQGGCLVDEGLIGEPDCRVEMPADVYVAIERGTLDAQAAFMSGKARASNLMEVMRYGRAFRKATVS
jgi:alkylation response protein AidB-like acyl-CoA dehydrogenase/putative sterol carrier protein